MAASSTARARTMFRVTVPMPTAFSVKAPSFSGFVFMGWSFPTGASWKGRFGFILCRVIVSFGFAPA